MRSLVLTKVVHDLTTREDRGIDKYGTTLDRDDLSPTQRLQHFYEEMLDGAMYVASLLLQLEAQGIELHDPRALAARERESCLTVGTQVWRATPAEDLKPGDEVMPADAEYRPYEKKLARVADAPHNWTPIQASEALLLEGDEGWVVRKRRIRDLLDDGSDLT